MTSSDQADPPLPGGEADGARRADAGALVGGVIIVASSATAVFSGLTESEALDSITFVGGILGGVVAAAGVLGWSGRVRHRAYVLGLVVFAIGLITVGHMHWFYAGVAAGIEGAGLAIIGLTLLARGARAEGAVLAGAVPAGIVAAYAAYAVGDGDVFGVDAWGVVVGTALAAAALMHWRAAPLP